MKCIKWKKILLRKKTHRVFKTHIKHRTPTTTVTQVLVTCIFKYIHTHKQIFPRLENAALGLLKLIHIYYVQESDIVSSLTEQLNCINPEINVSPHWLPEGVPH